MVATILYQAYHKLETHVRKKNFFLIQSMANLRTEINNNSVLPTSLISTQAARNHESRSRETTT